MVSSTFTTPLRETLLLARSDIDKWAEHYKEQTDVAAESYRTEHASQQANIDKKATRLLSMQLQRGLTVNNSSESKENMEELQNHVDQEIETLRTQLEDKSSTLQGTKISHLDNAFFCSHYSDLFLIELEHKVSSEKILLNRAHDYRKDIELSKETAMGDLERVILNYKNLGLEFEKAQGEMLRFAFTQLDEKDPNKRFSFCLFINQDDAHEVQACDPPLDPAVLAMLVKFADDEEMLFFVRGMRRAFLDTLKKEEMEGTN
jgi:hypothetical protein